MIVTERRGLEQPFFAESTEPLTANEARSYSRENDARPNVHSRRSLEVFVRSIRWRHSLDNDKRRASRSGLLIEVKYEGAGVRAQTRISDISLTGVFVETLTPL